MENGTNEGMTRRGLFAAAAGAAATGLLPGMAAAMGTGFDGCRWDDLLVRLTPALRAAYLAEVDRLAERLRPQFEDGTLHGYRNDDDGAARRRLEDACEGHFGLKVREEPGRVPGSVSCAADDLAAHLVLAVSPSTEPSDTRSDVYYDHDAQHAVEAVSWDVLAVARERGWYTPTSDESPDIEEMARRVA